jgi:hypothetical protein
MASVVFNIAKAGLINGTIDLNTDDIRIALLMTNTTADTEVDADTISAITTLDECDATGAARVALTGEAVNLDDPNDRAEFDANDASFTSLGGNATRDYQGVLVYKHITNDTDAIPICFVDFSADVPKAATQVDIPWNAEGILQLA